MSDNKVAKTSRLPYWLRSVALYFKKRLRRIIAIVLSSIVLLFMAQKTTTETSALTQLIFVWVIFGWLVGELYRFFSPRLGKFTSLLACALIISALFFILALETDQCYDPLTAEPMHCNASQASSWATSVLLVPILVIVIIVPSKYIYTFLKNLWGYKSDRTKLKEDSKKRKDAKIAARSGNPAKRSPSASGTSATALPKLSKNKKKS